MQLRNWASVWLSRRMAYESHSNGLPTEEKVVQMVYQRTGVLLSTLHIDG